MGSMDREWVSNSSERTDPGLVQLIANSGCDVLCTRKLNPDPSGCKSGLQVNRRIDSNWRIGEEKRVNVTFQLSFESGPDKGACQELFELLSPPMRSARLDDSSILAIFIDDPYNSDTRGPSPIRFCGTWGDISVGL